MLILGIETSCDETAASVVLNGQRILSNAIFSQIELHRKTGGVVPEVAAREHVVQISPVVKEALKKAHVKLRDIDAIAVTAGPGLLSSLLIGVNAAMTLALVHKKPLIPVNHIEGHMYANWLQPVTPRFPIAVLTASGGHNELVLWKNHGEYRFLGTTLDDAAGEAFDKVARMLGLPYPGGPQIQKAALAGDPKKFPLPRPHMQGFDFSFSGLKTAVLYLVKKMNGRTLRQAQGDIAASFQESVCEVLATKLVRAAKKFHVAEVHLAGGVSANARLRELVHVMLSQVYPEPVEGKHDTTTSPFDKLRVTNKSRMALRFCRDLSLCTDNAAMIAAAGYFKFKKNPSRYKKWQPIIPDPNLPVRNW